MLSSRSAVALPLLGVITLVALPAFSQSYPNKPVRMVVSGIAGSSNFAARLIAQGLTGALGQQVIVDGREGGVVVSELVAKAAPDDSSLRLTLAELYKRTGSYDQAHEQLVQVLNREPSHAEALLALANIEDERSNPQSALDYLNRAYKNTDKLFSHPIISG